MKRIATTFSAAGAAALVLAGCDAGDASSENGSADTGDDPVYAAMTSWDACEVLGDLQPVTDEMGIVGWGSSTAEGGAPGSSEFGNTLDPEAIGCNGLFNLGPNDWTTGEGEISVKIIPTQDEDAATAAYEERLAAAESEAAANEDAATTELADPWDQGAVVSWTGTGSAPNTEVIAQDGQWVFHIQLNHNQDYGLENSGEPAFAFTDEALDQWFAETYLPQVNQTVNDRIAEVE